MFTFETSNKLSRNRINNVRFNMSESKQITRPSSSPKTHKVSAILTASLALIASAAISAQETDQSNDSIDVIDEVVVVGSRRTVQSSIELK